MQLNYYKGSFLSNIHLCITESNYRIGLVPAYYTRSMYVHKTSFQGNKLKHNQDGGGGMREEHTTVSTYMELIGLCACKSAHKIFE